MAALFCENLSVNRKKKLIRELVQGKELADRLRLLIQTPLGGDRSSSSSSSSSSSPAAAEAAEELVVKILGSFTETLSVLSGVGGETKLLSADVEVSGGRRIEYSGESKKKPAGPKGRRGCYKRKKSYHSWRMVTSTIEDGHAWRKYGQKDILNTKHPRSYFRCTHKYDEGCRATKQVQKVEDNPEMYETIYIGDHTCRNHGNFTAVAAATPLIITDNVCDGAWGGSVITSSSSSVAVVKQEYYNSNNSIMISCKEETQSGGGGGGGGGDDLSENLSSSCNHDHQLEYSDMWEDLLPLDADAVVSALYSCTADLDHHHHHDDHQIDHTTTTTCHGFHHIDFESELCLDESDFFIAS